jgi:hypothetical protein
MLTLAITLVCALLSWRMLFPPLSVVLLLFLDPSNTAGTAAAVPYNEYTGTMAWGGVLGGVLTSLKKLHENRNNDLGGRFAWRLAVVCILMFVLIRISMAYTGEYMGAGYDSYSVGPLTLIIVVAYLWDRRAWWCFGGMLVVQLGLSLYVVENPTSSMNGTFLKVTTGDQMERAMLNLDNQTDVIGMRCPGQFHNTAIMAVHAAVGVAAGLALLIASRRFATGKKVIAILAGAGLILVGVYLLGASASRGLLIGLGFGILIHFLNARGPARFAVLGVALAVFAVAGSQVINLIPEDDPLFGRFAGFSNLSETEDVRINGILATINAIPERPLFGYGGFDSAYEATDSYLVHVGPLGIMLYHGVFAGVIACFILIWACQSDLTSKNSKALSSAPELDALCSFATMCCWIALALIMTHGYLAPSFVYILLGIAMWPMIPRPALEDTEFEPADDEELELPVTGDDGEAARS